MTDTLEERLRSALTSEAQRITDADLGPLRLDATPAAALGSERRRPWLITVAAAAAFLLAVGVVALLAGDRSQPAPPPAEDAGIEPTTTPLARAWPLNGDEPLPAEPEAAGDAARTYLVDVVGLPADWPIGAAEENGDTATVKYILQDVGSTIDLRREAGAAWFVVGAATERFDLGDAIASDDGIDVAVGPGPRTPDGGVDVRVQALDADGRVLASRSVRVHPPSPGTAASAPVARLAWSGDELAAAVRADVWDDHDVDPTTPDVVIGHATRGVAAPAPVGLPAWHSSASVFSSSGSPLLVARAYLRDRLPDAGESLELDVRTRGKAAFVRWSHPRSGDVHLGGYVFLLATDGTSWDVVAATTDAVDLSGVRIEEGRVRGRISSTDINSLAADVLDATGDPVPGSPRPAGFPGALYRFGTAAGPGDGTLDLDVDLAGAFQPVLRVNHVGGTLLSISEVALTGP